MATSEWTGTRIWRPSKQSTSVFARATAHKLMLFGCMLLFGCMYMVLWSAGPRGSVLDHGGIGSIEEVHLPPIAHSLSVCHMIYPCVACHTSFTYVVALSCCAQGRRLQSGRGQKGKTLGPLHVSCSFCCDPSCVSRVCDFFASLRVGPTHRKALHSICFTCRILS